MLLGVVSGVGARFFPAGGVITGAPDFRPTFALEPPVFRNVWAILLAPSYAPSSACCGANAANFMSSLANPRLKLFTSTFSPA